MLQNVIFRLLVSKQRGGSCQSLSWISPLYLDEMLLYQVSLDVISPQSKLVSLFPVLNNQYQWTPMLKHAFNANKCVCGVKILQFSDKRWNAQSIVQLQTFIGIFLKHAWIGLPKQEHIQTNWQIHHRIWWSLSGITSGESIAQASPFIGHLHEAWCWGESTRYNQSIHSKSQTVVGKIIPQFMLNTQWIWICNMKTDRTLLK